MKLFKWLLALMILLPAGAYAQQQQINCQNIPTPIPCGPTGPVNSNSGDKLNIVGYKINVMGTQLYDMFGTSSHLATAGSANAADIVSLWTAPCTSNTFLRADGTCQTPAGGGNLTNVGTPTTGQLAQWTGATTLQGLATTGSGNAVLATSPVLVTPNLGTPSALTLTSATGLPLSTGVTGNLPISNLGGGTAASPSTFWRGDGTWSIPSNSGGSVTGVSVVNANGLTGTVANASSTPAITLSPTFTGITYSNGSGLAAAVAGNFPTLNQSTTGNAATATALAASPAQCGGGQFATGVTATGIANCSTPAGSGNVSNTGTPTSGQIGVWTNATTLSGVATTGSGAPVLATSATLTTPTLVNASLGTPVSITLTNATGLPTTSLTGTLQAAQEPAHTGDVTNSAGSLATTVVKVNGGAVPASAALVGTNSSSQLTAVTTTGTGTVVLSTSPTLVTPALGTPSAVVLTNGTALPLATGVTGTLQAAQEPAHTGDVTNTAGSLATTVVRVNGAAVPASTAVLASNSSSQVIAATTTGTGSVVLATSPALSTPNLGTPSAVNLANATNLPAASVTGLGTFSTQSAPTGSTQCLHANSAGTVSGTGTDCGAGGGAPSFSAVTSGTNTAAAMRVGSGASLASTGSGSLVATAVTGYAAAPGKTLSANNSITLSGTDGAVYTFPSSSDTIVGTNAAQTLPNKTFVAPALGTPVSGIATNLVGLPLTTGVTGMLPQGNGGTGASSLVNAKVPVFTGTLTTGDCVSVANASLLVLQDAGAACGSGGGGGGSGTVTPGTANYFTYYPASTASVSAASPATAIGILNSGAINPQTGTSYTALLTDANTTIGLANSAANTFCIPSNANVAFPVGTSLTVEQTGTGMTTVSEQGVGVCTGTAGVVTLTSAQYGSSTTQNYSLTGNYDLEQFRKTATDVWELVAAGAGRPTMNGLVTLSSTSPGGVTGTLSTANGGTGQTTATAAINALLPSQSGQSGNCLGTNGTASGWITCGSGGSGGVGAGTTGQIPYYASSGSTVTAGSTATILGLVNNQPVNPQTNTSYTFVIGDFNGIVTMNNAASNTATVPPNSSVAFSVGTTLTVEQLGAGVTTVAPGSGVSFCSLQYGCSTSQGYSLAGINDLFQLKQTATNVWLVTAAGAGRPTMNALTNLASSSPGGVTGQLPVAGINASGTPSSSTYLRGDGTWAVGTGTVTGAQLGTANNFTATQTFTGGIGNYTVAAATVAGTSCTLTNTGNGGCSGLTNGGGDCGADISFSSSTPVTVTVPSGLTVGCQVRINQMGTGKVSVNGTAVAAATLVNHYGYTGTSGQYSVIGVSIDQSGLAMLTGDGS